LIYLLIYLFGTWWCKKSKFNFKNSFRGEHFVYGNVPTWWVLWGRRGRVCISVLCVYCLIFYISLSVHGIMKFIGLTYQGKDIVFKFIIEYSSLMDFGPLVMIGLFLYEDFWKMPFFWLVLKLEISYRVIKSWRILVSFRGFFEDYNFCIVKYLSFPNSSFALRYFFM
jgi:hypothetical protein